MGNGIDDSQVTGHREQLLRARAVGRESDPRADTDGNARDRLLTSRVSPLVYVVRFVQALITRKQLGTIVNYRDGV